MPRSGGLMPGAISRALRAISRARRASGRALRAISRALLAFGRFWWDFVVGDDVTLAIAVAVGLGVAAVLHAAKAPAWWVVPVVWALGLSWSLARVTRRRS